MSWERIRIDKGLLFCFGCVVCFMVVVRQFDERYIGYMSVKILGFFICCCFCLYLGWKKYEC